MFRNKLLFLLGSIAFWIKPVVAQPMVTKSSSEVLQDLKKLKVLGSVLYIAAHPDDENTRLLAYLSNGKQFRTAYLSLTRGDGGQNLIGDEQGIELGMIRTQELMAARRVDGAQQFFTRAYDFGYSKTPAETFKKWDHDSVLSDVVWVVRKFQPDVIIARFPEDERAGHGHHSASGILAREAFDAAADPKRFPEQLKQGVEIWQAKRMLWNTFNFGGNSTIDSTQFRLDAGGYNPLLGLSYGELAGESRSQHKSQGFGVPRSRGSQYEFFVPIRGDKPKNELLDGVDITWNRVPLKAQSGLGSSVSESKFNVSLTGSASFQKAIDQMIAEFNPNHPQKMVPDLIALHQYLKFAVDGGVWQQAKTEELESLILECMGFYAEATVGSQFLPEGDSATFNVNLVNRSDVPMEASLLRFDKMKDVLLGVNLFKNENFNRATRLQIPANFMGSQPYWLANGLNGQMFDVREQKLIGKPVNDPLTIRVRLKLYNMYSIEVLLPVQYKFIDPVRGEVYQPVFVTPPYMVYSNNDIILFKKDISDSAMIKVQVNSWQKVEDKPIVVGLVSDYVQQAKRDQHFSADINSLRPYGFVLKNYLAGSGITKDEVAMNVILDKTSYANAQRTIQYDHIPTLRHYYQDKITVLNIDLKLSGKKIGYIEGAGDRVSAALEAMGYQVSILKENDITPDNLAVYDAVITGIRAYNVQEFLTAKYEVLMGFVKNGGNLIVQYNTSSNIGPIKAKMSPYEFNIIRTRVTDERSPVRFLLPEHPVFNFPNKITKVDFEGWIQERSIYHGGRYDAAFKAPLGLTDFDEKEESGSLLIAPYGKGNFVYTGLVFFRQLPAAVPGAYRLLANLIGLPAHK